MRVRAGFAALIIALMLPASALGGRPTHEVVTFNDPAIDDEESAFVSAYCGFPVEAEFGGRVGYIILDRQGAPGTFELDVYGFRGTYVNPENGNVVRVRDIGPDRFYVQDGIAYVAVTGRSEGGTGVVGVVKINLTTGDVVHESGHVIGYAYDRVCAGLA